MTRLWSMGTSSPARAPARKEGDEDLAEEFYSLWMADFTLVRTSSGMESMP